MSLHLFYISKSFPLFSWINLSWINWSFFSLFQLDQLIIFHLFLLGQLIICPLFILDQQIIWLHFLGQQVITLHLFPVLTGPSHVPTHHFPLLYLLDWQVIWSLFMPCFSKSFALFHVSPKFVSLSKKKKNSLIWLYSYNRIIP